MVLKSLSELKGALSVIIEKSTTQRITSARKALAEEIVRDTDNFVPYDTGHLSSQVEVASNGKFIKYTADYAEYVYNMPESNNFNQSTHTQATSHWFEASKAINREKWLNSFKEKVGGK